MPERAREIHPDSVRLDTQFFEAITRSDAALLQRSISEGMREDIDFCSIRTLTSGDVGSSSSITDEAIISKVTSEIDEWDTQRRAAKRSVIESPEFAPHMEALRQAIGFFTNRMSGNKSHFREREPTIAEQEVIRQTKELELNGYRPLKNRWDNYYAFDRARRDAQKPITDAMPSQEAAQLAKHLRTFAQELVFSHFRQALVLGYTPYIPDIRSDKLYRTITRKDLPSITFRPTVATGDMRNFRYEVLYSESVISKEEGWSVDVNFGEDMNSLAVILQDEYHLYQRVVLDQMHWLATFLFDGAELLDTVVAGGEPNSIRVEDFLDSENFLSREDPIVGRKKDALSYEELLGYAMLQIAKKRTALSVQDLFGKRKAKRGVRGGLEKGRTHSPLDAPLEVLAQLSLESFQVSGDTLLLHELHLYSGRENNWKLYKMPHFSMFAHAHVTSLRPMEIATLKIGRKEFTSVSLTLPEFSRLTALQMRSQNGKKLLKEEWDYRLVRDEVFGTYLAVLTPQGKEKVKGSKGLLYDAVVERYDAKYPAKEKSLDEIPVDSQKLMLFVRQINSFPFHALVQELQQLLVPGQPVVLKQVMDIVASHLQYSILPKKAEEGPHSLGVKKLLDCILGIDTTTGKLRVQCTHTSSLVQALVRNILPDTLLAHATIDETSVVRRKTDLGKRAIFGAFHTYTRIHMPDGIASIDITPKADYAIFERELISWQEETQPTTQRPKTREERQSTLASIIQDIKAIVPYEAQIIPNISAYATDVARLPMVTLLVFGISCALQDSELPEWLKRPLENIISLWRELRGFPKEIRDLRIKELETKERKILEKQSVSKAFDSMDYFYNLSSLAFRLLMLFE